MHSEPRQPRPQPRERPERDGNHWGDWWLPKWLKPPYHRWLPHQQPGRPFPQAPGHQQWDDQDTYV